LPAILIVDDDAVDLESAERCLRTIENLSVSYARNGKEALESVRKQQPDLVLTDLRMPGMNGLELVETVRRTFPLLPVVLMTSQGSEQIAVRALKAGAASYVPKMDLKSDLAATVQQVLQLAAAKRSERELFKCLQHCETRFVLNNDPVLISQLVGYFLNNLERIGFGDDVVRTQVGIALMEAVSNAMIHGNLEVGSELRRDKREEFDRLITQRRSQVPYSERRVMCTAKESVRRVEFVIRDEGPGFDSATLPDPIMPENLLRVCGRGVMLIRTFMDVAEYNEKGNEIRMIKRNILSV
jgi:CheY-like chemotaxis protein/anti-sigma regulatory factor (Ser/Thr protein kinase)